MKIIRIACALLALIPAALSAHYIWLEFDGKGEARLFFGGVEDNERETSPGKLDKIVGLKTQVIDTKGKASDVENQKTKNYFRVPVKAGTAYVVAFTDQMPVADLRKYNLGVVKPNYYARYGMRNQGAVATPTLPLDITPLARTSDEILVTFQGKPLEKAKATLYAPNTWAKEYKSDAKGRIKISLPWTGEYVIEVIYFEKRAGSFADKNYEGIRHRATYTFVVR